MLGETLPGEPLPGNVSGSSTWPALHPPLLKLIREHTSTMVFVNSRRLAERMAQAVNELAGEEVALAHHGSLAKDARAAIEDRLKRGTPAIIATSSLELGIDVGAVDLVVQIEAPPSIASAMQRVGRAGHAVGLTSKGRVFPKHRGDLLVSAAVVEAMRAGNVERTRYPRNPLDVLAQHIVAAVAMDTWGVDDLYNLVRQTAPYAELTRGVFEGVLDMLSGRYPSSAFAGLTPRVVWDRIEGRLEPRKGSQRLAVTNGGTIPDRGLYGVYLAETEGAKSVRVGELDEEMVFECQPGEVFLLGASSWRITEVTHDRVLVTLPQASLARCPSGAGTRPGAPWIEAKAVGALSRRIREKAAQDHDGALEMLVEQNHLTEEAASTLLQYLSEQTEATGILPSDSDVIIERFRDEVGDMRVVVLTPFGSKVHAPWATAVGANLKSALGCDVDSVWSDDGMLFRIPDIDDVPEPHVFVPAADDVEDIVVRHLPQTALFASHFRENAGRALLLPKRMPGKRTPLWLQRRRAADLLSAASEYPSFPIVLETVRDCLQDVFDIAGLRQVLREIEQKKIRVTTVDTRGPSPFASSLVYSFVANFVYDGDAPLAERRAQILSLDQTQLAELLGSAEMRELLDPEAIAAFERQSLGLQPDRQLRDAEALHDTLLRLGDLSREELGARVAVDSDLDGWVQGLLRKRRIMEVGFQQADGSRAVRYAAAEDAGRYRDALGIMPPMGLPEAFLAAEPDALEGLVMRYARNRGPFEAGTITARLGLGRAVIDSVLRKLVGADKLLEGAFLPNGQEKEFCHPDVMRQLKRQSLARLRKQVEPVAPEALGRFLPEWHGITDPERGLDAVLNSIEMLQGLPLPVSILESNLMPTRVPDYSAHAMDTLCSAGELVWRGFESVGTKDGKIGLYLADDFPYLAPLPTPVDSDIASAIREVLQKNGAVFFDDLTSAVKAFKPDVTRTLWLMVWAGEVTNDTFSPLRFLGSEGGRPGARRDFGGGRAGRGGRAGVAGGYTSRRRAVRGTEGRWSLLPYPEAPSGAARFGTTGMANGPSETERRTRQATQILRRHGVVTKETIKYEIVDGGFAALYPIFKAMEESGKARRGYFIQGQGGLQFSIPGAEERLRSSHAANQAQVPTTQPETPAPVESIWGPSVDVSDDPEPRDRPRGETITLSSTDPANPYGATLAWPTTTHKQAFARVPAAHVVVYKGALAAYFGRPEGTMSLLTDEMEPDPRQAVTEVGQALAGYAEGRFDGRRRGRFVVQEINGAPASGHACRDAWRPWALSPAAALLFTKVLPSAVDRTTSWAFPEDVQQCPKVTASTGPLTPSAKPCRGALSPRSPRGRLLGSGAP